MPRLRRPVVLAGLLTLLLALFLAPAARAHDVLIATDPEDSATVDGAPSAITLTFNNSPLDVGSAIVVADSAGETVTEGPGTVSGTDVVLELDTELAAGDYEVQWRVASSDGHPIEGTFGFTVEGAAEPAQTPDPPAAEETGAPESGADQAVGADEATEADEAGPAGEAGQADEATSEPTEETSGGLGSLPLWLRVAIALAAVASVAGLIVIVVRRMRGDRV